MTLEYQLKPKETSTATIKKKTFDSFTKGTNETFKVIKTGEKKLDKTLVAGDKVWSWNGTNYTAK